MIRSFLASAVLLTAAPTAVVPGVQARALAPAEVARELLAADRAFAAASRPGEAVTVLERAFADDVVLATRTTFVRGRSEASRALRDDAELAGAHLSWTPIRAGISADAMHGFTYGYTTVTRADGSVVPDKYVAYWERDGSRSDVGAWRISVYRRVGRPPGQVSLDERPPALPPRLVPVNNDRAERERLREELAEAERTFSRDAKGGASIGEAFARTGDPTAANVGGDPSFTFTPEAIGASVQTSITPEVRITWGPDETRVASSGDLGVTIGFIAVERAGSGGTPQTLRIPYFTIWRRDNTRQPWRYVAE